MSGHLSRSVLQRLLNGQRRQVAQEYRLSAPELEALVSVEATTFENLAQALQDWMNERRLSELMTRAETWAGKDVWREIKPKTRLVKGRARRAIPQLAEELQVELIVMGTIRHAGIAGILIGNTAETVLDDATCSILAMKPDDFVSPIEMADQESHRRSAQS